MKYTTSDLSRKREEQMKEQLNQVHNKSWLELMFEERKDRTIDIFNKSMRSEQAQEHLTHDLELCDAGIAWARVHRGVSNKEENLLSLKFKPGLFANAMNYYFYFIDTADEGYNRDFKLREEVRNIHEKSKSNRGR